MVSRGFAVPLCGVQLVDEPVVADRQVRLGQFDGGDQLGRPKQRHGQDGDTAGLEHPEPGRDQPGVVRGAKQNAVSGQQAELAGEQVRHLVGPVVQLAVAPFGRRGDQAAAVRAETLDRVVDQPMRTVEPVWILELRPVET